MKKAISMIALITLACVSVFSTFSTVSAADKPTFKVGYFSEQFRNGKRQIPASCELELYFGVYGFEKFPTTADGINAFTARLDYDTNIFHLIEASIVMKEDGQYTYNGIKTESKITGEAALNGAGAWGGITFNHNDTIKEHGIDRTNVFALSAGKFVNDTDKEEGTDMAKVVKVILRVKGSAEGGKTKVGIKDVQAANGIEDITPSNADGGFYTDEIEIIPAPEPKGINYRLYPWTTVEDFKDMYPHLTNPLMFNGNPLKENDFVPTGATIEGTVNGVKKTYEIITVGDMNSDGVYTALDLSQCKLFSVNDSAIKERLSDVQKKAADLKYDAVVQATDLSFQQILFVRIGYPDIQTWSGSGSEPKDGCPVPSIRAAQNV